MGCGGSTANPATTQQAADPVPPAQEDQQAGAGSPAAAETQPTKPAAKKAPEQLASSTSKLLKEVPLLQNFSNEKLNKLSGAMMELSVDSGEAVFKQGDAGTCFYIIVEGEANVVVEMDNGERQEIGHLNKSDYFGETALQNDAPRGASIIAVGLLKLLSLSKEEFDKHVGSDVQFVSRRIGVSAETGAGGEPDNDIDAIDTHLAPPGAMREKSAEVKELIFNTVSQSLLFTGLTDDHINAVIDAMYKHEVPAGTSPIREGDPGNNLFIIESGSFECFIEGVEGCVASPGPGELFGELALMYNAPRAATVTATTAAVTWKVDRYTFRRIARNVGEEKLKERIAFLAGIELLSALTTFERSKIAEGMDEVTFDEKIEIFQQGDVGDAMYIIKSGSVVVTIPADEKEGGEGEEGGGERKQSFTVVNRTSAGDYFGERSLLTEEPRAATVTTVSKVVALCLKRHDFKLLLGPLADIMKKRIQGYDATGANLKDQEAASEAAQDPKDDADAAAGDSVLDSSIKLADLQVLGTLGKGSFGHVQLVKHKENGNTYALKAVNKQQIVDTHQQEHIMSEKRVMMRMNHPFLIHLYQTFKDPNSLYFLLEPVMGGELFSLLRRRRLFKESTARFFAGCVISAFEYLHKKDTVYRDLKPENLLIDNNGYIKVTDFGFAKKIGNGKTWTLCGTPDYLAPEIVSGRGHGKGVDWWTVGVLIYEMIASYTPFYHQNQLKMYDKIVRGKYRFPSHFSRGAKMVVADLLEHKPTKRLGVIAGGAKMIKNHEWFEGFDWKALESCQLQAPIPVKIKDKTDLSNFDVYDDDQHEKTRPYKDDGSNWDGDF